MNDTYDDTGDPLLPPGAGPGPDGPTTAQLWAYLHDEPIPTAAPVAGLGRCAEAAWAALIVGPDPTERDALDTQVRVFRAGFGEVESPIEAVMLDQLTVAYLETVYFDTRTAECLGDESTDPHRDFLARGADRATRKLAFLLKQFFVVRPLLRSPRARAGAGPDAFPKVPKRSRHEPKGQGRSDPVRRAPDSTASAMSGGTKPTPNKRGRS